MPYLGAALSALVMAWSSPALAQDQFKDLDPKHWAYEAVTDLQQKGILVGYPNGYFQGKRTLTRYEFAIALKRALDKVQAMTGPAGPQGPAGEAGPAGPPGMTPEEVANLRRLTDEFRNELTALGANVRDINNRLDALAKDVADIKDYLAKQPKFSVDLFTGIRTDRSRYAFIDYGGALRNSSPSHFSAADVLHDLHLGITGNLPGGVKFIGDLTASNYLSYRGNTLSAGAAAINAINPAVGGAAVTPTEQILPYQAQLDIPIGGLGSNTVLTVGRFKHQVTPLTYYRPDLDPYFDVPQYDDGNYVQDGARLQAKFGSATTSLFAASYASVTDSSGNKINQPLIGFGGFGTVSNLSFGGKPFGLAQPGVPANQVAGLHIGVPLFKLGELGVTAEVLGTSQPVNLASATPFNSIVVYGANFKMNPIGRLTFSAEAAKSVLQIGFDKAATNFDNEDNNAYNLALGYNSGPITASAGYQYIDPRFSAPGYWNKLGNWYNPTNIMGPFVRVGYKIIPGLRLTVGGDFLTGARNRGLGALNIDDNVNRVNAGLSYKFNKRIGLDVDYEGVFYDLSTASTGLAGGARPQEQYLTFGAGLNLATNTVLKLAYQIITYNNFSNGFGLGTGYPAGVGGGGNNYTSTVFTTQLAVHF